MDRDVKIYRKLLQRLVGYCSRRKCELWESLLLRKRFNDRKIETDFERGYCDGYHAAMNDVLKWIDYETEWAESNWRYIDGQTR